MDKEELRQNIYSICKKYNMTTEAGGPYEATLAIEKFVDELEALLEV